MRRALGEWDKSIARLGAAIAEDRRTRTGADAAQLHVALGAALFERGRFDEADRECLAASGTDPARSTPHLIRGLIHALTGAHQSAALVAGGIRTTR